MARPASAQTDPTQTFLPTPNNPIPSYPNSSTLPVVATDVPGDGLKLVAGATPYFTMIMGSAQPGANILTGQDVRNLFFMDYNEGNMDWAIGSPMDTGQSGNNVFAAVARHYAVGDPNDLHVMQPDGLHLRAVCAGVPKSCTPGNVYAGMIRLQAEFRPGMTIKVRYKSPAGQMSWAPIWLFQGLQISPGPGNDAYVHSVNQLGALIQYGAPYEIDMNDNYLRSGQAAIGHQLDFGVPTEWGQTYSCHAPYWIYAAQGNGYSMIGNVAPPFEALPFDWSADFHDLVMSWSQSGTIAMFVDGIHVISYHNEYPQATYVDAYDRNKVKTVPLHLIIGNQAIPSFEPHPDSPVENEGLGPDGWAITVQGISAWYGTVQGPYVNPAPNVASGMVGCSS